MTYPGFSFNGKHTSEFDVLFKSQNRQAMARKRTVSYTIPGVSGTVEFPELTTYENKQIVVTVYLLNKSLQDLRTHVRSIVQWLSAYGELSFDDEPGKFYVGQIKEAIDLDEFVANGQTTVIFEVQPFAHSRLRSHTVNGNSLVVNNAGNEPACVRLLIKNTGDKPISSIHIQRKAEI